MWIATSAGRLKTQDFGLIFEIRNKIYLSSLKHYSQFPLTTFSDLGRLLLKAILLKKMRIGLYLSDCTRKNRVRWPQAFSLKKKRKFVDSRIKFVSGPHPPTQIRSQALAVCTRRVVWKNGSISDVIPVGLPLSTCWNLPQRYSSSASSCVPNFDSMRPQKLSSDAKRNFRAGILIN